jgi:pilus assembly protein Flp/PilA
LRLLRARNRCNSNSCVKRNGKERDIWRSWSFRTAQQNESREFDTGFYGLSEQAQQNKSRVRSVVCLTPCPSPFAPVRTGSLKYRNPHDDTERTFINTLPKPKESQMLELFVTTQNAIEVRKAEIEERGATAVEYALMVGLIAVGIIGAVVALKDKVGGTLNKVSGTIG